MQRSDNRIVFLHGFLGSPEDWEGVIQCLPDFECHALEYPFQIPEGAILVGYSMGGRIAMRYPNPKILLSAHPGLRSGHEKRWREDSAWIDRFRNEPLESVLRDWYAQPLFESLRTHSQFHEIFARRSRQDPALIAKMLEKESLAHQPFTIPDHAVFLHGEHDLQFAQLYRDLGIPSLEIPGVGHAAHVENPQECTRWIAKAISDCMQR